ncbi:MAG: hypothetical protein WCQ72_04460 [Eubacteriales bacterium]
MKTYGILKKITASLLGASLLISMLASCGSSPDNNSVGSPATTVETSAAANAETSAQRLYADVPSDAFYDGYKFTLLLSGNWDFDDFTADELDGEPINDAIYQRNSIIEEKYGVEIAVNIMTEQGSKGSDAFKNSVMAGDNAFDAAMMGSYEVSALAYNDYLIDLNKIPYLDLTKPWWDQKANADLSMKGIMYYTTGSITTLLNDCTYCILFNKTLINNYGMDNPYELVYSGGWTLDKFASMTMQVSEDIDGSGTFDSNDKYGAIIWDDSMLGMVSAIGEKVCSIKPDGEIELTLYNDRVVSILDRYLTLVLDKQHCIRVDPGNDISIPMFSSDRALFYTRYLRAVSWFRDMTTDFGVLVYPKYDENQEDYYTNVHAYGSSFVCIPKSNNNTERTGILLEAIAAESLYLIQPAYYEITLVGKYTRDDESVAMLDMLISNRVYDVGLYYQVGTYNEQLMNLFRKGKNEFVSMYQKYENKALDTIDTINEAFSAAAGVGNAAS